MKVFSAEQTHEIDLYTICNEPIKSIDLMERASHVFADYFLETNGDASSIVVFAGSGNNGGDALAVARILSARGSDVFAFVCKIGSGLSEDCQTNYKRFSSKYPMKLQDIDKGDPLPDMTGKIIIDGIFGSGLNRPVQGYWAKLIEQINSQAERIYSIDIPSGMFADSPTSTTSINADRTLSFEFPKFSFFFPQSFHRVGEWESRSIGLSKEIREKLEVKNYYVDDSLTRNLLKKRAKFQHKGHFGHVCLIGSSFGKTGAMILAGKACMKTGAGLVSYQVPEVSYIPIQSCFPEAMILQTSGRNYLKKIKTSPPYDAYGIGCGLDQHGKTKKAFFTFLKQSEQPLVLDADALNLLGKNKESMRWIPENSILTPHPKEFERMFGPSDNDFARNQLQRSMSEKFKIHIVLKGMHTCISDPYGSCYFNLSGNPGMATAGSGDVLTGILSSLVGQSYTPLEACLLGVYLHGLAGDLAEETVGQYSLIATDIIDHLSAAFKRLSE